MASSARPLVAYFSMEIALDPRMPTYAGGLGILAGDTVHSAADLSVPMVVVTLLHRKGYLTQRLDASGWQREEAAEWAVEEFLEELPQRVTLTVEGRTVHVRGWRFDVAGIGGSVVPVIFLDTDLPENAAWDRSLTHFLYGGEATYRLCQEVVLGIGGVRLLRALGYAAIERYHMNEGHAALLGLELLDEHARQAGRDRFDAGDVAAVRAVCVFTTHTPVAAGHDQFPKDLVTRVLGRPELWDMNDVFCCEGRLNMTFLALNLSHYVNGVAKKHAEVSRGMFIAREIDAITNGVHAATWTAPPFQELFDRNIPGWRSDNDSLRYALSFAAADLWEAHARTKATLLDAVNRLCARSFRPEVLTLGFARRATPYKRGSLLLKDPERLRHIARSAGGLQIVYGGKAHPNDLEGKALIQAIIRTSEALRPDVDVAYVENYDAHLARILTAGVDLWVNTPQPPLEASGTSGMKAALNGVPSLSVLDGWWLEGCIEGVTGWAIGTPPQNAHSNGESDLEVARCLYDKLEQVILPMFLGKRDRFIEVMRHTIALNGAFFNTQRMVTQYVLKAYLHLGNHNHNHNHNRNHAPTLVKK
jgi:starch phosphorylase